MAKPLQLVEVMLARFPAGMFDRIAAALRPGEDRATFVRTAVEAELQKRATASDAPRFAKEDAT